MRHAGPSGTTLAVLRYEPCLRELANGDENEKSERRPDLRCDSAITSDADERVVVSVKSPVRSGLKVVCQGRIGAGQPGGKGWLRTSEPGTHAVLLERVRQVDPVADGVPDVDRQV